MKTVDEERNEVSEEKLNLKLLSSFAWTLAYGVHGKWKERRIIKSLLYIAELMNEYNIGKLKNYVILFSMGGIKLGKIW